MAEGARPWSSRGTTEHVEPVWSPDELRSVEALFRSLEGSALAEQEARLERADVDPSVRDEVRRRLERRRLENRRASSDQTIGGLARRTTVLVEPIEEGSVVSDRYRVERLLGRGGMGEVFLAVDERLERPVALKFLLPGLAFEADQRRRFLREARAASALSHPNVCVIFEVGEEAGRPFMAMEMVEGETLDKVVSQGPVEPSVVIAIAKQIAEALAAAHAKGIVHRDIKPANISRDARGQVKVLDFGLAKRMGEDGLHGETDSGQLAATAPGTILGTPAYMSPEQILGREVDHRSDLYSTGVVLYELSTGRRPFQASSYAEMVDRVLRTDPEAMARADGELPAGLVRIVRKCLEKDIERRYSSARALLADLELLGTAVEHGREDAQLISRETVEVAAPARSAAASPPFALGDVGESDVFISYAWIDDQPLANDREGWIAQLHRNLEIRVEQISGERVRVCRMPGPAETAAVDPVVLERLPQAKTMISVLSPPFVKSSGCREYVERFWDAAGTPPDGFELSPSRIFKVVKHPVSSGDMPPRLAELFGSLIDFDFYDVDPETGRVRELAGSFSSEATERYHARVYDLAREISHVLRAFRDSAASPTVAGGAKTGKLVYLATTTSDLAAERDAVRRELLSAGHGVLPDQALPLVGSELEAVVRGYLERVDFAVHLVGALHGVVPEGSSASILEVQNRVAAELSRERGLPRLIWIPGDLEVRDARQKEWIDRLRRDSLEHSGAELIESHLEAAKDHALEALARRSPEPAPEETAVSAGRVVPPRVYLICDASDAEAIEPLEDYLFEQGLEVSLPDFEADEAEAAETHRQNLVDCDAVIVYYGRARHAWVDIKLRGLLKAAGYGRSREWAGQLVYAAPPFDRRKERFRTRLADVVRQHGEFDPSQLEPLVRRLREARDAGPEEAARGEVQ